jgi:sugar phosphate isomerase/epimerase
VQRALDAPDEPAPTRLDALFAMDTLTFLTLDPAHPEAGPTDPAKENRHYSLARYFVQFLDRKGQLWPMYRTWQRTIATDPTGEKAFAAVTGRTPGEADADWEAYVRGLAPPATENPGPR